MTIKYNRLFAVVVDLNQLIHQTDDDGSSIWTDAEYQELSRARKSADKRLKDLAEKKVDEEVSPEEMLKYATDYDLGEDTLLYRAYYYPVGWVIQREVNRERIWLSKDGIWIEMFLDLEPFKSAQEAFKVWKSIH